MGFNLKDYEMVKDRITRFLAIYPDARLTTELVEFTENYETVIFKAKIYRNIEEQMQDLPLATGYALERFGSNQVNKTSHLEQSSTSALGRALANAGFYNGKKRPCFEEMQKTIESADPIAAAKSSSEVHCDSQGLINELRECFKRSTNLLRHKIFDNLIHEHGRSLQDWPREVLSQFKTQLEEEVNNEAA